jgi:hypothetical protein
MRWNPPIALPSEERKIAARTRKTRKFFVFLREHRPEILDADFQHLLAQSARQEPGGQEPVDAGLLALATLLQAYGHVGDRDAVELTVMDKRWQLVLDGLGAEPPPCSQGTLCNCRMRLIAHDVDKILLDRTVALAEKTGGFGARQLRAVLDSPPLVGAGRVEDTLHLLGHALRQAVGLAAQALGISTVALREAAGLTLVGHSRLKAALDLDGGEPSARARALGLVLEEVARWQHWLEQQHTLAVQAPPIQEGMEPITQMITQDTEPDPEGGPGGRRITKPVAPDRRIAIEDKDRRHGRKRRAKTFNGFKEHCAVDLASTVTREVVVRPANEPEHEAVELLAETLEQAPGLLQRDIDLGSMASPRIAQWAEQGVDIIARPWPHVGPLFTKQEFTLDCAALQVTCPGGQTVPLVPGKDAQFPAAACDRCPWRAQCTKATLGHGRSLHIRADAPFQQKLRTKMKTQRGRASRRKRTAVEHTIAQQLAHPGRRARDKGLRKNQFDGRRHAAVSNLQRAAHDEEEHRLAS